MLISCRYNQRSCGVPAQILGNVSDSSRTPHNPAARSSRSSEPGEANRNIVRASGGISAPRTSRSTGPIIASKNGCSNAPHASKATRPSDLSTRNISDITRCKSLKNMMPQRQVMRSMQFDRSGIACASPWMHTIFDAKPSFRPRVLASKRPAREPSKAMTLPPIRRCATLNAGSPEPAARSSTIESGSSAAAASSASVIAVFQSAEALAQRSLTRARAAASHKSGLAITSKDKLYSIVGGAPRRPE